MTELPAWIGNWTVEPTQAHWLPWVPFIGTAHIPYPDGEQALFVAGTSRVAKIRITDGDFSIVDEIYIPGYDQESISTADIRRIVKEMAAAGTDESKYLPPFSEFISKIGQGSATIGNGVYTIMDKDGSHFVGWGTSIYKVADVHKGDVYSPIQIVKSYDVRDGLSPQDAATQCHRYYAPASGNPHLRISESAFRANKEVNQGSVPRLPGPGQGSGQAQVLLRLPRQQGNPTNFGTGLVQGNNRTKPGKPAPPRLFGRLTYYPTPPGHL